MNDEFLRQHRQDEPDLVPKYINLALLELDEVRLRWLDRVATMACQWAHAWLVRPGG